MAELNKQPEQQQVQQIQEEPQLQFQQQQQQQQQQNHPQDSYHFSSTGCEGLKSYVQSELTPIENQLIQVPRQDPEYARKSVELATTSSSNSSSSCSSSGQQQQQQQSATPYSCFSGEDATSGNRQFSPLSSQQLQHSSTTYSTTPTGGTVTYQSGIPYTTTSSTTKTTVQQLPITSMTTTSSYEPYASVPVTRQQHQETYYSTIPSTVTDTGAVPTATVPQTTYYSSVGITPGMSGSDLAINNALAQGKMFHPAGTVFVPNHIPLKGGMVGTYDSTTVPTFEGTVQFRRSCPRMSTVGSSVAVASKKGTPIVVHHKRRPCCCI